MKRLLFPLIVLFPFFGSAQTEPTQTDSLDPIVSVIHQSWMYHTHNSFGVFPEIQFIKSPTIAVSASYARLTGGEWMSTAQGVNLGFEFDPLQQFYGPKASVWAAALALVLGGNVSLSTMYYFQENRSGWYLRPEVGIGIPQIHLKYGYGFRLLGDEIMGVPRHSLTLGAHITIKEIR